MGRFLEEEKVRQAAFRATSPYFSDQARAFGLYRGQPRAFCIPRDCAAENLFEGIRSSAPRYFAQREIKWHDGEDAKPSNHLCSSQVCAANFLFPFADKPEALAALLRPVFPLIERMLPIDGQYVTFEWIGQENYLREKTRTGKRTRGANFTSADAAVMFERQDALRQIVLVEWKYTESYSETPLAIAGSGTDRTQIYAHLYEGPDCSLEKSLLGSFADLFFEPFYQLMRQQMLAQKMETARELGADVVSVLHIAPECNSDFARVTSPHLATLGVSPIDVWKRLVRQPDRFTSVSTERLFGGFQAQLFPELADWWEYTLARYAWLQARPAQEMAGQTHRDSQTT